MGRLWDANIILKWTSVNNFQFVQASDKWQAFVLVTPPGQNLLSVSTMFQFCQSIAELPQCSAERHAITVTETVTSPSHLQRLAPMPTQTVVLAACNCPPNRYWKLHQYSNSEYENGTIYKSAIYKCSEVTKASRQITLFTANLTICSFFQGHQ
jgi:hypothetical protein